MATSGSGITFILGNTRGEEERHVARPGEDIVSLAIAGGPTLLLHPENARDLLLAQDRAAVRSADGAAPETVQLAGGQLAWPGLEAAATRGLADGWLGQATLDTFSVITGVFQDEAADLAASAITRQLDGQVDEGVYRITPAGLHASFKSTGAQRLAQLPLPPGGGAMLVLLHGTFVETSSTFSQLFDNAPAAGKLFERYGEGNVYALDHRTLAASPIANALSLAQALPAGARVHLLTHSRGGVVGEVLARACGGAALTPQEEAFFAKPQYRQHLTDLRALVQEAQGKGLRVERMVRVACPSRGTLLASRRLDAYLSVLQWGLQLAGTPVAPQFVAFAREVARRRARPEELPGLEALMPGSALVQWLNARGEPLPGELRVIAGDIQGDSVVAWVKTLLADAFYWTDNDLVVHTRSMYGGMPRSAGPGAASFVLDRGGKVSHFNYFANARTVAAVVAGLTDDTPADYAAIGPLSWAGQDASGLRTARAVSRSRGGPDAKASDRPAVFVLPGILGSNLQVDGKRVWLGPGFVNGLKKLAWGEATVSHVEPDGPIGGTYDDLIERLADTHEVIPFAFDWRRPMEDEGRRLASAVRDALEARKTSGRPVRLFAHSMGGLVARTMQLVEPAVWDDMMRREGARVVMLGVPHGGSWAPMQVMSGDDTFGNALVAFGSLFDNAGARKLMAGLPGFVQLQAGLTGATPLAGGAVPGQALDLRSQADWQQLVDADRHALQARSLWHEPDAQIAVYDWSAPSQDVLDRATRLRAQLDAQLPHLVADPTKFAVVAGRSRFTPAGITMGEDGLEYLNTPDGGDGRVTLPNALLPGVRAWQVDASHGKLPDVAEAFAAYVELLEQGTTTKLEPCMLPTRGAPARGAQAADPLAGLVRGRPSRMPLDSQPPSEPADVMATPQAVRTLRPRGAPRTQPLRLHVLNGDLQFVDLPLMVGHYHALRLTGTEAAVDRLQGKAMSRSLAQGLYPDGVGRVQLFESRRGCATSSVVIVAGLGHEGELRMADLSFTVRQAVLAHAQRHVEQSVRAGTPFDMAATLIGSGGTGITPGGAAQAIAEGAAEANQRLLDNGMPTLANLTLVEVYLERAADAWRALRQLQMAMPDRVAVEGRVSMAKGHLTRAIDAGYRGAGYDFISVLSGGNAKEATLDFRLDTRRARAEITAQHAQGNLLRQLVASASNDRNADPQIGRTLFNLLVPVEIEPFLGGSHDLQIELDETTAAIPWELLDTRRGDDGTGTANEPPWAIRTRLIRKLQVHQNGRDKIEDATRDDGVLVIGEPKCDFPPLPAARREAMAVAARISESIGAQDVLALVDGNDAQSIVNGLYQRPWRAIHIAGHGKPGADGGVVLSGQDVVLGANEMRAMRTRPELVFLNCCHLADLGGAPELLQPDAVDRPALAAGIAKALIEAGVRCVIAAGWAVEDLPAQKFADGFWRALIQGGQRFIEAVATARAAARAANPAGNTWAAYQCYGDADWTWSRGVGDAQGAQPQAAADDAEEVASPVSLIIALQTIASELEFRGAAPATQLRRLDALDREFSELWGGQGEVAQAFGVAYSAAHASACAAAANPATSTQDAQGAALAARAASSGIAWLRRALEAPDGGASLRTIEQLSGLLARSGQAWPELEERRVHVAQAVKSVMQAQPAAKASAKRLAVRKKRPPPEVAPDAAADAPPELPAASK